LSLADAPVGTIRPFSPGAPTGNSSTLTISIGATVAPGVYNLVVNGSASAGKRSTALTLTVNSSGGGSDMTTVAVATVLSCALKRIAGALTGTAGLGAPQAAKPV
jgi:hypothetical protein